MRAKKVRPVASQRAQTNSGEQQMRKQSYPGRVLSHRRQPVSVCQVAVKNWPLDDYSDLISAGQSGNGSKSWLRVISAAPSKE